MNRLVVIAVVLLGACSIVDLPEDRAASSSPMPSPAGSQQDVPESVASEALSGKPSPFLCVEGAVDCCGNGICEASETCASCSRDCGSCCGNGICEPGETCFHCPECCQPIF